MPSVVCSKPKAKIDRSDADGVRVFLQGLSRYPLLTADQEVELANKIKPYCEIEELRESIQERSGEDASNTKLAEHLNITEQELDLRIHIGRSAKKKMVESNLRLVVSIAKKYLNRGLPLIDLIQEGTIGLSRAAEKFDPSKNFKFSTYAYWWIRQAITRSVGNDSRTVRLPIHTLEKLNKLKKTHAALCAKLSRNPTHKEIAEELGISVQDLRDLYQKQRSTLSLNFPVGSEKDTELGDIIGDTKSSSPESKVDESLLHSKLDEVLSKVLNERERDIISLRFGLTTGDTHTLQEVADEYGIGRERVRQIQTSVLRKLRKPSVIEQLDGWVS